MTPPTFSQIQCCGADKMLKPIKVFNRWLKYITKFSARPPDFCTFRRQCYIIERYTGTEEVNKSFGGQRLAQCQKRLHTPIIWVSSYYESNGMLKERNIP